MNQEVELEEYKPHEGTIKISGSTSPLGAGKCAFHFLTRGVDPIDFFCIGAAANQQATKSMGVFLHMVEHDERSKGSTVAFKPYRYKTLAKDGEGNEMRFKDCTVWKTIIVTG